MQFWPARFVSCSFISATDSKNPLPTLMSIEFVLHSAHLVLSDFTSSWSYLLVTNKTAVFFFTVCQITYEGQVATFTFFLFSDAACKSVRLRKMMLLAKSAQIFFCLQKNSKMAYRITLAIVCLTVPKRGGRKEAGTISGARQCGKKPGARLCSTCFGPSRQYYSCRLCTD